MNLDQTSVNKIVDFIERHVTQELVIAEESRSIHVNDLVVERILTKWSVKRAKDELAQFHSKTWAIAYAVAVATNNKHVYEFLDRSERRLHKLRVDRSLYDFHHRMAIRNHDETMRSLLEGRLNKTTNDLTEVVSDAHQVLLYQSIG
jgi:hypothetical protein